MACIRGMLCHWRKNGHRHFNHPQVFYLYVVYDIWVAGNCLPICSFLDEYQKVYFECKKESTPLSLIR